jgi:hypothetical protein
MKIIKSRALDEIPHRGVGDPYRRIFVWHMEIV